MNSIKDRLAATKKELPEYCTLVAVSKTKPSEDILEAYNEGHLDFGENKVQELVNKAEKLPKDIKWHMIGHLQRNKVKHIASFIHLIHGVDSIRLLNEIDKQASKNNRIINCLLQVHIAAEETKFGFGIEELKELLSSDEISSLKNICIKGLMGMATNTSNSYQVADEFESLKTLFDWCKVNSIKENMDFSIISTGMSGDYHIAIQKGSNMVRIGSSIFGARNYQI